MTLSSIIYALVFLAVFLPACRFVVGKVYPNKTPEYRYWTYRAFSSLIFFSSYMLMNFIENKQVYTIGSAATATILVIVVFSLLDYYSNTIKKF